MLINVTIPVLDEEKQLAQSISQLFGFVQNWNEHDWEIVVADNGSSDKTFEIACALSRKHSCVRTVHLNEKGRGRAVKAVWLESQADIVSYMDVDLSTDLAAFPALIEPLVRGTFDIATGSRLLRPGLTSRGAKREYVSRSYNILVKTVFRTSFSDAQCGFKALTGKAARELLPLIENNGWFMDTELLVLADKLGYKIFDLPVRWIDDPDTRVKIIKTAVEDLKGIWRLRHRLKTNKTLNARNPSCQLSAP